MIVVWMEAALRSLALALAVWAGLRLFRVRNVLALKSAWILVLAAAFLAPFAARWPLATVVLPVIVPHAAPAATVPATAMLPSSASMPASAIQREAKTPRHPEAETSAPAPFHRALPALNTGSGNIGDEGVGREAKLETGSGNILASGMQGGFKAETGSGNIGAEGTPPWAVGESDGPRSETQTRLQQAPGSRRDLVRTMIRRRAGLAPVQRD